jgi:Peptidase family M28
MLSARIPRGISCADCEWATSAAVRRLPSEGICSMRHFVLAVLFVSCFRVAPFPNAERDRNPPGVVAIQDAGATYQAIFNQVDKGSLLGFLQDMAGVRPVTAGGRTFAITDRYLPQSKANFRAYWAQYFRSLGMTVNEMAYPTQHRIGELMGHNLEAVLPGQTQDSVIVIVHYDSIGPVGQEAANPGVDDDMTGMAIMLETARLLSQVPNRHYTVRFVAADYEEQNNPGLEGARRYAQYIKNLAQTQNFKLVAAVDNEQSGWECSQDGRCGDASRGDVFDVYNCSGRGDFNYPKLGDALEATAVKYSTLKVHRGCLGANSDHYAMWEIGVPAVVYSEHSPFNNPHFDRKGGDTYNKIDQEYFFRIAQIGVTFAAELVELAP